KALWQSIAAENYIKYLILNRYKINDRKITETIDVKDMQTWSIKDFQEKANQLLCASLNEEVLLQNEMITDYKWLIKQGYEKDNLRPTLYDILAHRAINFSVVEKDTIILNDQKWLSNMAHFSTLKINAKTSSFTSS